MTLAESTMVRDLRETFKQCLEDAYGAVRVRYRMLSAYRIAFELGVVAVQWGWTLADQAKEGRLKQMRDESRKAER